MSRITAPIAVLVLLLATTDTSSHAQVPALRSFPARDAAVAHSLEPGAVAYPLPDSAARSLALRPEVPAAFRPAAPFGQERGRRYTKRGAIIGGAAGALGGLGVGVFIAALCGAESSSDCSGAIPVLTLLGAGAGALGGAIIGAAIPRPTRDTAAAPPSAGNPPAAIPPASEPAARRRIGSASLAAGAAAAPRVLEGLGTDDEWRSGAGLRLNLFAELGSWFAIGPQLGQAWLGDGFAVRHAALAMRASHAGRWFAPYLVVDAGAYQTRQSLSHEGLDYTGTLEFLGGSVGAGTRWFAFSSPRVFLDLDARWHRNLQNIERFDMTALSLAVGRSW